MNQLLVLLRRPLEWTRRSVRREHTLVALWVATIAGVEVLGRRSPNDVADVVGMCALVLAVVATHYLHWLKPVPALERLIARVRARSRHLERFQYRVGPDLRLDPPLPRAVPTPLVWAAIAIGVLAAGLWLGRAAFPGAARQSALAISPLLYFIGRIALWAVVLAGCSVVLVPPIFLRARLEERGWLPRLRRTFLFPTTVLVGYVLLVGVASSMAPTWIPLAASGVAFLACGFGLLFPGGPRLTLMWRPLRGERPAATFEHSTLFVWGVGMVWGALCSVTLLTVGDRLAGTGTPDTGVTTWFGAFFAWATAVPFVGWTMSEVASHLVGRLRDPARVLPAVVRVVAPEEGGDQRAAAALDALSRAGFVVAIGGGAAATDVRIRMVATRPEDELTFFDHWPLDVSVGQLADPELHFKLARRDEILRRRHLLRGLRRAMRPCLARVSAEGLGIWVDPHLWFSASLVMERDGDESRVPIGPAYRDAIPLASRCHLYRVLRALEVDLVFVERGVSFKQLRRVFAVLFETYDVHGGRQRALNRHFRGLVGLRVTIELHASDGTDERPSLAGYPEPDYEDVGRARILHVFRDRGGRREVATQPRDTGDVPQPMLV